MRKVKLRIVFVEKQLMACLTIRRETDSLIETALGIGLMTVITVKFLAFHWRNVRREMALMIETDHVGITRFFPHQLKFWMVPGKGGKNLRISPARPRHFEDNLLHRMWPQMKHCRWKLCAFLRRRFHDGAAVVTRGALQIRDLFHARR